MKGSENIMKEKSLSQKELLKDTELEHSQDTDSTSTPTGHNDVNEQQEQQDTDSTSTPYQKDPKQQDTDSTSTPCQKDTKQQQQEDTDSTSTSYQKDPKQQQQQQQQQEDTDSTSTPRQKEQQFHEPEQQKQLRKEKKLEDEKDVQVQPPFTTRQIAMIILLCYINLLNYMDRMGVGR
ncbi:hypothetical protein Pcinc_036944 [Petrolisthes cinctipes]|uniref:Uncharacterized protein n=1 Tax=Petrolisthes cinctipes TaxID=88211 RepID=A0AAE1BTI4_PETCI|nr:hypothetical protein Pcinc_036944 [Petrolisthes cinctipes]